MSGSGEIDRSLVGSSSAPFPVEVEKGAIRRFAKAVDDPSPVHVDADAARSLGFDGIIAPPTFPTTFRPPEKPAWLRGLDEGRILAGEQEFRHARPIVAGEVLECQLVFSGVEDKQGGSGAMELLLQDLVVRDAAGEIVCINRRVVIYRAGSRSPS